DFLSGFHETQTPSPILFQNSLHNSTLGFTTIHLGLTGPALTVSADKATISSALETAQSLLEVTPYALVCFVDYIPTELEPYYLARYPFMEKNWNRAFCCALARPELIESNKMTVHKFEEVF
ncbi:MAG: beta-ketoacyl synthase chain length factor, partial [Pseudobdellovibrionaceae bacterium]